MTPLEKAARELIADVRARHPGEELTCPYMRALDAALVEIDSKGKNGQKGIKRPFAVRWRFGGRRRWNTHGTYKTQELAEKAAAKIIRDWKSHNGQAYVCPTGEPDMVKESS